MYNHSVKAPLSNKFFYKFAKEVLWIPNHSFTFVCT